MFRKNADLLIAAGVALFLLWGVVRAATSGYEERVKAAQTQCAADQKRLGLAGDENREKLFAKYPTPEITLCPFTRIVPGATKQVVARGRFASGTRFLLESDNIEVIKEELTASDYRADIKAPQSAVPSLIRLTARAPVSCGTGECPAVYVGGKYEWNFTAANGWLIKLKVVDEGLTGKEGPYKIGEALEPPHPIYCAEYYRAGEAQPFAARSATGAIPWAGNPQEVEVGAEPCGTKPKENEEQSDIEAELEKLTRQMMNPDLSEKARDQLGKQLEQLMARMADPNYMQQMQKEKEKKRQERQEKLEEICRSITFQAAEGGRVEGTAYCDKWELAGPGRYGRMPLKGAMSYVGP